MSKLYIRLPAKSVAESAAHWLELACPFALAAHDGSIEREGILPLSALMEMAEHSVVLLLAASDVTLLRVQIPPLSAARLKAALPNLVEDFLIADPSDCVIVAGGLSAGLRTVAVVDRAWLDLLNNTLIASGVSRFTALPAQLCLPCQHDRSGQPCVTAALNAQGADIEIILRLSDQDGMGLLVAPALVAATDDGISHVSFPHPIPPPDGYPHPIPPPEGEGSSESLREFHIKHEAHEAVLQTLRAVAKDTPITLYVPQAKLGVYQEAINPHPIPHPEGNPHPIPLPKGEGTIVLSPSEGRERSEGAMDRGAQLNVLADNWEHWIAGASALKLDLLKGAAGRLGVDWRAWRWPLALAATVLVINAAALNIDWWRMQSEASALRAAMMQTYKSAYPKESVIIDPVAQMRQKIAIAKRDSGQSAPDDFTAMAASFGEAWASVKKGKTPPDIATLAYRERSLLVRFNTISGAEGMDGITPQLKAALAERNLSYDLVPGKSAEAVWRIRSAK